MTPTITTLKEKYLVGKRLSMSLSNNKTPELWRSFMPLRRDIKNAVGQDLYSVRVYIQTSDLGDFSKEFDKWAAVEVSDLETAPEGMENYTLTGGLYAVFLYKGSSSDSSIYQYIYGTWLPNSGYTLDNRAHFEVLGEKYKNNDPSSEEEIWIPIKS